MCIDCSATRIFVVMFTKWNNDIMTKPARPPLDLGEALTRNRITTWSGLSSRHIVTFYVALLVAFLSPETTLTLRNLASELQEVVDWYRVGLSLGIKSYQLEEIRINRMGDAMHCKLNMLDLWLRGDVDASWSKLVGALAESNHSFIADRIREKYLGIKVKPSKLLSFCSVELLHSNPLN